MSSAPCGQMCFERKYRAGSGRTGPEALTTTEELGSPIGGSGFAADPERESNLIRKEREEGRR